MFVDQNGATPPQQQQQQQPQHIPTDPELQLREQLSLHQSNDMLHQAPPHLQQMGAMSAPHHHFQTPPRPVHSPQHMAQSAQSVMGIDDHNNAFVDHDSATRKRSKVSRACDECRRKKVRVLTLSPAVAGLIKRRFDAMRPARTVQNRVRAASALARVVSSVDSP